VCKDDGTEEGNWVHKGGGHFWYIIPDDHPGFEDAPTGNGMQLGGSVVYFKDRIILTPPSVRPEGAYTLLSDADIAPQWLLEMLEHHIAGYTVRRQMQHDRAHRPGVDPIDTWAADTPWAAILEPDGWAETHKQDSCGCPTWTRPGDASSEKSATAHEIGCARWESGAFLHLWTDNGPFDWMATRKTFSKLQYIAHRDHDGDVAAAMRELDIGRRGAEVAGEALDALMGDDVPRPFEEGVRADAEGALAVAAAADDGVESPVDGDEPYSRIVDLGPYLDGTYVAPQPETGATRNDGARLLYPGRWHSVVGLTTAGKSWLALWHAVAEMREGNPVVYLHFEEPAPEGTIARLRQLGCDTETIREHFVWMDCATRWHGGEMEATVAGMERKPALVILDGINASVTAHGHPPNDPETVGWYRSMFVTPNTRKRIAVLSLGHPPKDRTRQGERHGFGATGWLDEVDGVGFRMEASTTSPIRKDHVGYASLYSVKDRYGEVEKRGIHDSKREAGWYYMGSFMVDSTMKGATLVALTEPVADDTVSRGDKYDVLGSAVLTWLAKQPERGFKSTRHLRDGLSADKILFDKNDLSPALTRLAASGQLDWPELPAGAASNAARPGWVPSEGEWPGVA
jgi:hypothetical protein